MRKIYTVVLLSCLLALSGCEKYLEIKPVGSVIPTTAQEYRALLARAYKRVPMQRGTVGFRSDEMQVVANNWDQQRYADWERWNDVAPAPTTNQLDWGGFYNVIFVANHVIENQKQITEGTPAEIDQLAAEAYLLRAYMHFMLVNLHGQPYTKPGALTTKSVPLKLDNDLEGLLSRNTVEEVYTSIQSDVNNARALMNKESWEVQFSYRFTKDAVEAFQARLSLYKADWQSAYDAAQSVLDHKSALEDLNAASPVLPNNFQSVENITALERMESSDNNAALAPANFLSMYEQGDRRLALCFSAPNADGASKSLKVGASEFSSTFRVGELYLTAAEAAAHLNQLPEARARLLQLMQKRYTPEAYAAKESAVNALTQEALIAEILNERARELAFEGHRWFDLRRTTRPRIEKVLKGETFVLEQDDDRYTILIPKEAIAANPELAK